MVKKSEKKISKALTTTEKVHDPEIVDGVLFPLPKTPLGEACGKYIKIKTEISELKVERDLTEEKILIEMEKEGHASLIVTVDMDNWLFEVKKGEKKVTCVKKTRNHAAEESN